MATKLKTIDIQAKEWFDKVNGNSYFAGTVTVNYGTKTAKSFNMPFQYGYGDQYRHEAVKVLKEQGLINTDSFYELREQNIIIRSSIQTGCKKAELKHY